LLLLLLLLFIDTAAQTTISFVIVRTRVGMNELIYQ